MPIPPPIAGASAGALLLICLLLLSAFLLIRRRCRCRSRRTKPSLSSLLDSSPRSFSYDQIRSWTNGFDSRRKIGHGGFGCVYLAQLEDGATAAVKRLHRTTSSHPSFRNEISILSSLRHPNLVRLHGYCCDPRGLILVYDYVPNGTLSDHLHGSRRLYSRAALTLAVRIDIALQTAAALQYLHFDLKPAVVHRDVTSSNIFVEGDMRIKVGDFGMSRVLVGGEDGCCTGPQGTPGYLDPDYHRTFRLTEKSDVYSLGVVMMELVTGKKAVDGRRGGREATLAEMVVGRIQVGDLRAVLDPALVPTTTAAGEGGGEVDMGAVEAVAELAFRCVAGEKDDRPDAREIVEQLTRIRSRIRGPPPLPSPSPPPPRVVF